MVKETSVNGLKAIIHLMKTYCRSTLEREHAEFLLIHNWAKHKNAFLEYLHSVKMTAEAIQMFGSAGYRVINQAEDIRTMFMVIENTLS